jgi:hypothetical protein
MSAPATMSVMPKKPTPADAPKRKGFQVAARLDADLELAFKQFLAAQRVPPTHGDVLIVAVQEFLQREGYYPPKKKE